MKLEHKRVFAGLVAAAAIGVGFWIYADRGQAPPHLATQQKAGQGASPAVDAGAGAFPWERASHVDAGGATLGKSEESKEKGWITSALISLDPPALPVSKILEAYRNTPSPSPQQKMAVLAALSYCENKRPLSQLLADKRSRGESTQQTAEELEKSRELCRQVPDSAYMLRRQIIQAEADSGSIEAMLSFSDAGPLGRWPDKDEYVPLTSAEMQQWQKQSIDYLERAASLGSLDAYKALSGIYAPRAADNGGASYQNAATSYAYDYIWATGKLMSPDLSAEAKQQLHSYIKYQESQLTVEQMKEGRKQAKTIVEKASQTSSLRK